MVPHSDRGHLYHESIGSGFFSFLEGFWGEKGKLNDLQQKLLLSSTRAKEELYDLRNDPWELNNLADDPDHSKTLQEMRKTLNRWIRDTGDLGQNVEPMKMYDSDMKVYLNGLANMGRGDRLEEIKSNIAQMKSGGRKANNST